MNASPKSEWLILPAASVTVAGWAAHEPLIALGAAALAALIASGRSRATPALFGVRMPSRAGGSRNDDHLFSPVFHAFSGGDWASVPSTPETDDVESEDAEDEAGENAADRGSRAYEEFAANLEEEDPEEISFLPPYASNAAGRAAAAATKGGEGGGDSLLAEDLTDSDGPMGSMPVPRRFALGTVAIIRHLLEPSEVERILVEQRRYPRLRFGDVAVQLGLLSQEEVQELLIAQEQGIFSEQEIADARTRLATYHNG